MEENKRILKGYITNCLACNRSMQGNECTRTYPNSDELIGICNSCIKKSHQRDLPKEYVTANEGETPVKFTDSHSNYFYEWFE